jgi:hypothetical protein
MVALSHKVLCQHHKKAFRAYFCGVVIAMGVVVVVRYRFERTVLEAGSACVVHASPRLPAFFTHVTILIYIKKKMGANFKFVRVARGDLTYDSAQRGTFSGRHLKTYMQKFIRMILMIDESSRISCVLCVFPI